MCATLDSQQSLGGNSSIPKHCHQVAVWRFNKTRPWREGDSLRAVTATFHCYVPCRHLQQPWPQVPVFGEQTPQAKLPEGTQLQAAVLTIRRCGISWEGSFGRHHKPVTSVPVSRKLKSSWKVAPPFQDRFVALHVDKKAGNSIGFWKFPLC